MKKDLMNIVEITEPPFNGKLYRQLTRDGIDQLKQNLDNDGGISVQKLVSVTEEFLESSTKSDVDIDVSHIVTPSLEFNDTAISGIFEYDDLVFEFYISVPDENYIPDFKVKEFVYQLIDTLEHETIHYVQKQKQKGHEAKPGKGSTPKEEYLSRPDEIEAYALNIARELYRMKSSVAGALSILRTARKQNKIPHDLQDYQEIFSYDNEVFKKLLKRVYHYLIRISEE